MSCTVKADGPCRRTLSFEVERASLEKEIESRLGEIASSSAFKGFRKGKTPMALVRRTHGKKIADEARQQLMGRAFADAVKEHELHPVGDPVLNLQALDEGEGPVTFELDVEVAPDFELSLADSFPVTVELRKIDDALVDGEVLRIRERFGTLEDVADGEAVGADDLLEGTVTYVVDGEQVATRDTRPAFLRHGLLDGIAVEGLADSFEGKQQGDTVELSTTLPEHFEPKGWQDKEAQITFVIDRHRRLVVPELTEEALKSLGLESEDQLRERVQAGLDGQRRQALDGQVDRAIEEQLIGAHEFELPERLLAKSIDHRVHEVAHKLMEQQGMDSQAGHDAAEERRGEIAEAAQKGLKLAFVVDAIARANELGASPEQAVQQVQNIATREGGDPEEAVASAIREGWLSDVQEQLTSETVRAWLRERADVTEQDPADG
jgi:trigger factor